MAKMENENPVNIHNPTIDTRRIYTNSLFIYKDRAVIRTYDHNEGVWIAGLDRTFPFADAENIRKGPKT